MKCFKFVILSLGITVHVFTIFFIDLVHIPIVGSLLEDVFCTGMFSILACAPQK